MTPSSATFIEAFGDQAVVASERLGEYSVDGLIPELVVSPEDVEGVSAAISVASRERLKVCPRGGGTQMALGNPPTGLNLVLGTGRLERVLFHEPADLVASVQAGMTLEALQRELASQGQFLPLEAPIPSRATIGGIIAANASGPSRLAYGTPRDWLIGIKVVRSDGVITKSGGRVVKNVSGYDLNKLYTGSLGTLGVIVEATFKLAPLPRHRQTLVAVYPGLGAAIDSAQELLRRGGTPQAVCVINHEIRTRLPALDILEGDGDATLLALYGGRKAAVERSVDQAAKSMEGGEATAVESLPQEIGGSAWQAITDLGWAQEAPPRLAIKISALRSQVGELVASAGTFHGLSGTHGLVADIGSGMVRLFCWERHGSPISSDAYERAIMELRTKAHGSGAHVVVERCPAEVKGRLDVWGDPVEGVAIMRRIKHELDPAGMLNPGRFVGGI